MLSLPDHISCPICSNQFFLEVFWYPKKIGVLIAGQRPFPPIEEEQTPFEFDEEQQVWRADPKLSGYSKRMCSSCKTIFE